MEALVRWNHPQTGLIPPSRFIPFSEQTGLIVPLGRWVLQAACRQVVRWLDEGLPPVKVAVNLSPRQFRNGDIVAQVRGTLEATGLPPQLLELEITEGAIMEQGEGAVATLGALKTLGVQLAIDDFGTGYSSLAYLRRFPIDVLKIDQSFMRDIPHDPGAAQLAFLRENGCDLAQGYLHGRPVAAAEFETLLRKAC